MVQYKYHHFIAVKKQRSWIFLNSKLRDDMTDNLFKAILQLRNVEECYAFFEDLCTVSEIKALAQRLEVAKMLKAGCTYSEISEKTGASTATVSRVNKCLNYGADGYKLILDRMQWSFLTGKCAVLRNNILLDLICKILYYYCNNMFA